MCSFNVRKAVPADAPQIAGIERLCFSAPWSENAVLSEINKQTAVFLVCEQKTGVIGYASFETVCGECYMGNLAVYPKFRRKGAAAALLNALRELAERNHCAFITLEVRASNTPARTLYERCGFSVQGVRRGFYTDPAEDAVIYTLFLQKESSI